MTPCVGQLRPVGSECRGQTREVATYSTRALLRVSSVWPASEAAVDSAAAPPGSAPSAVRPRRLPSAAVGSGGRNTGSRRPMPARAVATLDYAN